MHRRLSSWLVLVGTVPTFAGCSAGPSDEDYDDVASSIGALTASDAPAMDDSMTAAEGQEISGLTSEGSGTWSGERLGLSYRYELTCMDGGGEVMALCGDATDTAHLVVEWSGELDLPRLYASAERAGDWTLSNIQSDVVQLDGTGSFDMDLEWTALYRDVTKRMHLEYDAVWNGVQISRSMRRGVGGSAVFDVHVDKSRDGEHADGQSSFDIEAVVTFQPDGNALLELDGSRTYHIDVATGEVSQ